MRPAQSICFGSATTSRWCSRAWHWERSSGKEGTSRKNLESDGKRTTCSGNEGVLHSQKRQKQRRFLKTLRGKGKKGYTVNGNFLKKGRFAGKARRDIRSMATLEQVRGKRRYGMWILNAAERLPCNEGQQLGRVQRIFREVEKSSEWTLERKREAHGKVARDEIGRLGKVQDIFAEKKTKHGLFAADHRASRWNGRSHLVVYLPALQEFSFGGPHLVGIDGTR